MRDRTVLCLLAAIVVTFAAIKPVFAQQTGFPPFGSFQTGGFDGIDLQDLNVNFSIPVVTSAGRGQPFSLPIVYDSLIWLKGSGWIPTVDANGNPTWGWKLDLPNGVVTYTTTTVHFKCYNPGPGWFWANKTVYTVYYYEDPSGTSHYFPVTHTVDPDCWGDSGTFTANAADASGYYLDVTNPTSPVVTNPGGLKSPDGTTTAGTIVDTNGNYITQTVNGNETDWTDSVGRVAAKVVTGTSSIQYKFLDGSGTNTYQTATLVLTSMAIKTNFGCSTVLEYNAAGNLPNVNLPTELDISTPGGTTLKYLFAYEPTPQNSGYYTGRIQKVTLHNGGTYEYDYGSTNDGINCADGTTVSVTRKVSDGTTTGTWTYAGTGLSTLVTDAAGNDANYTFDSNHHETAHVLYSGTGGSRTIQRTINTGWAANGTPASSVVILEDNSTQSETDTTYDSNGLLDSMTEYDWGTGAHGGALRTTLLYYLNSTPYTTRNIINRVTTKIVEDGGGTYKYRQDIAYDGVAIANHPTGVPQHDDTNYPYTMNYRGNPTSVTVYMDPVHQAQGVVTNLTYDVFGNVLTSLVGTSVGTTQQQQFNFSSATKYALPDSIVSGPSTGTQLTQMLTYKTDTGQVATSKDPNNQPTTFAYDFLRRVTSVTRPDNALVTYSYDDTNHKVTVTSPIDSSRSTQQITAFDKLGRPLTSTTEDGSSTVYSIVQTNYDAMGRAYRTSNPYTGSPSYWTTTTFDALSRPTQVQLPDNSSTAYSYATNTVTVTDPAGKKREQVLDGAGRLAKVLEPDVTNGNLLTVETDYTYTVLDSLATVSQGAQTRTYTYDGLGRPASTATPEAGTVCFGTYSGTTCQNGYDNFGNLVSRTDARGVVTSYAYDTLNRLVGISYPTVPSGVSPMPNTVCNPVSGSANSNVCFYYDQGGASAYALGRQTKRVDASGSETYSYNNLGEMTQLQKAIGSNTYPLQYAYNAAGELLQTIYPSGHSVYESYDGIGRLCEVAATSISSACGSTTTPYLNGFAYNVANELTAANYANGVAAAFGFSSDRLQLSSLSYTKGSNTLFGLTYAYGTGGTNDGQIAGITDTVQPGRTASYTYDAMGRLSTAVTVGSSAYPKWGLSFSYDRYGNRTSQASTAGNPPTNSLSFANPGGAQTNHPDNYTFDGGGIGGNMTYDGYNTLSYDGENRMTGMTSPGASATYTYDSTGLRVQKSVQNGTTTVYVYSGRRVIAEYENGALPANPTREYIYSGGAIVAKSEGGATIYFHGDHLSTRLLTDSSGNVFGEQGHYPFGEACYAHNTTTKWEFTTYERDAETDPPPHYGDGNDYAEAREHVNRLGRFSSADPVGGSSSDPQSLNRYAYVENDPINLTDPTGSCPFWGPVLGQFKGAALAILLARHALGVAADGSYQTCQETVFVGIGIAGWYSVDYHLGTTERGHVGVNISSQVWVVSGVVNPDPPYEAAKDLAMKVLSGNNDCSNFFSHSDVIGATALEGSSMSAAEALASDHLEMAPLQPGVAGYVQYSGQGPGSTIQLSQAPNGAFTPDPFGLAVTTSGGIFAGSTLGGQTATILHELAHTLGLIPDDGGNRAQSLTNSGTIGQNCAGAILAAIAGMF